MGKFIFVSLLFSFFICIAHAQFEKRSYINDAALATRGHAVHFTKMKLWISLNPAEGLVKGKVTHYFTPLRPSVDSFFLDAIKMNIKEILLNDKPVKYHNDSSGISILPAEPLHWNTEYNLTITYEVNPQRGLYFIGWNDKNNLSRKQVWSQGEAIDNRCWIPMYDDRNDKLLTEMYVTFDSSYKVLSNGKLEELKNNNDGTNTWHYAMSHPQAPYLVMLGIGKYDIKETHSASGVPMHFYYYPEWKDRVEPTFEYSEAMVDFYEKEIGVKYPWESYSQIPVQDYMFGAMENTTATIFGDFYMVDKRGHLDRNYIGVNSHELAHQWFGDYVTARSESHQWLQESFATYYNQLFEKETLGQETFDWDRRGSQNAAIEESNKNKFAVAHSEGGGVRIYGKGAFVLNMLKYIVGGREVYNKAIKYYLEKHPYQNVDSHDLLIAFEETTGMELEWFWDEWIYRGGEPSFKISFSEAENNAEIIIKQTQQISDVTGYQYGLYKMPAWIEIHYTDETTDKKLVNIEQQTEIIKMKIAGGKKKDFVLFDPGNEILKSVSFNKPFAMLQSQAIKSSSILDRYDAIAAMKNINVDIKRETLINVFNKEKYFPLRTEIVSQLANDSSEKSIVLIKSALADKDAAVRKAALRYASPLSHRLLPAFENLLSDSSYDIIENALLKLTTLNPSKTKFYLAKTKGVEGIVGKSTLIKWLEISYNSTGKKQYADELVNLTSGSYEFRTRGNAMAALKRSGYFTEPLIANLIDALLSPNDRLNGPAKDLLKFFSIQTKYKKMITDYIASVQWNAVQKSILKANDF